MSASVVNLESENLMVPCAAVNGMPMAFMTCEGSSDPEVQALPLDAQIPYSLSLRRMPSPSTNWKAMLLVLAERLSGSPVTKQSGTFARMPCSRRSLRRLISDLI